MMSTGSMNFGANLRVMTIVRTLHKYLTCLVVLVCLIRARVSFGTRFRTCRMKKKYLVYGGCGATGASIVRRLLAQGNEVHVTARSEEQLAKAGFEHLTSSIGDVCDDGFFEQVGEGVGDSLDGLVYAIGTIDLKGFQRTGREDFLHAYNINALGAALAVQASLRALKRGDNPASVVLFSTVAAERGFPFHASIAMAKGAVEGLMRSLASELAPKVRVNAVAPSLTKTPLAEPVLANEAVERSLASSHPMQRLGHADDIASISCFLLSDESSWMTGQVIHVDGGRSTLMDPNPR